MLRHGSQQSLARHYMRSQILCGPSCPDNLEEGGGGRGGQRDKYLWLRRTLRRAGTQTQGQEARLKMEAKLPPGPSLTSFFPKILTEDSALLIPGAQKSFSGIRYNQRFQYPAYPQPDSVIKAASMAHLSPDIQTVG